MASFYNWFSENWFNLIQTFGIVAGLLYTAAAFRSDNQGRRLSNLLTIKQEHRELWSIIHENPRLSRILDPSADLIAYPMTDEEEVYLRQVIVHFAVSFECIRDGTPLNFDAFAKRHWRYVFTAVTKACVRASTKCSISRVRRIRSSIRSGLCAIV